MTCRKCEYEVTVMTRNTARPEFSQKCSLTGHACFCSEDRAQCIRRTFALDYERKRGNAIKPQQGIPIPDSQD
jgi:hypothetical protein